MTLISNNNYQSYNCDPLVVTSALYLWPVVTNFRTMSKISQLKYAAKCYYFRLSWNEGRISPFYCFVLVENKNSFKLKIGHFRWQFWLTNIDICCYFTKVVSRLRVLVLTMPKNHLWRTFSLRKSHKSRWLGFPAGRPQVRDEEWQDFNILLISALKSGSQCYWTAVFANVKFQYDWLFTMMPDNDTFNNAAQMCCFPCNQVVLHRSVHLYAYKPWNRTRMYFSWWFKWIFTLSSP